MDDILTRETRYTGRAWADGSAAHDVQIGECFREGETGKVEFRFCRSCGCAVVAGREDDHERFHQVP
jgi:hypothetical protein